jgi:hypothetical protein
MKTNRFLPKLSQDPSKFLFYGKLAPFLPLFLFLAKNFRGLFQSIVSLVTWTTTPHPRLPCPKGAPGGQMSYLGCASVVTATQVGLAARLHPKKNGHALVNVVPPLMGVTVSRLTRHTSRNM